MTKCTKSFILLIHHPKQTTLYMRRMLGSVMRTSAKFTGIRIWSIYIIMWPLQIMISGISMKHSFWKEPFILATKLKFAFERGTTYIQNQKTKKCQIFFQPISSKCYIHTKFRKCIICPMMMCPQPESDWNISLSPKRRHTGWRTELLREHTPPS